MNKNKALLVVFVVFFLGSLINFLDHFILGTDSTSLILSIAGLLLFGFVARNQYMIIKGIK